VKGVAYTHDINPHGIAKSRLDIVVKPQFQCKHDMLWQTG
jgi:hypothetical protein